MQAAKEAADLRGGGAGRSAAGRGALQSGAARRCGDGRGRSAGNAAGSAQTSGARGQAESHGCYERGRVESDREREKGRGLVIKGITHEPPQKGSGCCCCCRERDRELKARRWSVLCEIWMRVGIGIGFMLLRGKDRAYIRRCPLTKHDAASLSIPRIPGPQNANSKRNRPLFRATQAPHRGAA